MDCVMTFISITDFHLKKYATTIPIGINIACITRYHGQHFFCILYLALARDTILSTNVHHVKARYKLWLTLIIL
jgi:hypothetical protein